MTIWILVGPDGKPFKGTAWRSRYSHDIKAYDNERSAKNAASQFDGVSVQPVTLEAAE